MGDKPVIVACIPAFNEESSIGGVIGRAKGYVDRVLVCDDGSGDMMDSIAWSLGVDAVVMLDGDGWHDPGGKGLCFCVGDGVVGAGF